MIKVPPRKVTLLLLIILYLELSMYTPPFQIKDHFYMWNYMYMPYYKYMVSTVIYLRHKFLTQGTICNSTIVTRGNKLNVFFPILSI